MKPTINKKISTLIVLIIFVGLIFAPVCNAGINIQKLLKKESKSIDVQNPDNDPVNDGTEYWALIFAVGVYYKHPGENRPSMLQAADDMYEVLVNSPNWKPENIHLVKAEQATGINLIRELLWLIRSEDSDDYSLIYITTHGYFLNTDNFPKDEVDGKDEILVMYHGFEYSYAYVWDDLLNFFISLLQSKGVCVIIDSCYAGGFNDYPMFNQDRVTLMSCREFESCYGSYFSDYLIDGLWGLADLFGNQDGVNTAEEAFFYARFWVELLHSYTPTMRDLYPLSDPLSREFPIT
jgi:hypothetical protein